MRRERAKRHPRAHAAELHERVATNIRRIAQEKGVTLSHLPDFADVNGAHFWFVLSGKRSPTVAWLGRLASALSVDVRELFDPVQAADKRAASSRHSAATATSLARAKK